jgi:glutaredoxin-like YruB-family protein
MNVIVYTSPTCGYCKMVKDFLSQRGIGFTERDVSLDRNAAQEVVNRTGQMGVPVTIIDGQTIVGFDRAQLERVIGQGRKPSFGISVADASKITARQGAGITLGAYVGKVNRGSLAERLGLAVGDIIVEVNMRNIANATDFEGAISTQSRGNRVAVVFLRGNRKLSNEGVL